MQSDRCTECNGTGRDPEHRAYGVRLVLDCDHIYCSIHGDIGYNYKHANCPTCLGTGKAVARAEGT